MKQSSNCSVQVEALAAEVYTSLRSGLNGHPLDVQPRKNVIQE